MSLSYSTSPAGNAESIAYFILPDVESYLRCPEVPKQVARRLKWLTTLKMCLNCSGFLMLFARASAFSTFINLIKPKFRFEVSY